MDDRVGPLRLCARDSARRLGDLRSFGVQRVQTRGRFGDLPLVAWSCALAIGCGGIQSTRSTMSSVDASESSIDAEGGAPKVLLFGGAGKSEFQSDTWIWDGTTWARLDVTGPSARAGMAMATLNGGVVLFGGVDEADNDYDDTWTSDGSSWMRQNVAGPHARDSAGVATMGGVVVLFGGFDCNNCPPTMVAPCPTSYFGDTWAWDGSSWAEVSVTGPSTRASPAMAALNGSIVLFGGFSGFRDLDDTWTWDGASWTRLDVKGPSARNSAAMTAVDGVLVLSGGGDQENDLNDTWTWDGAAWTVRDVAAPGPLRDGAAMTTRRGTAVLFGGENEDDDVLGDTWIWNGADWTKADVAGPSPRVGSAMAGLGGP
jgi:N-acetylneuraminic acid mutarotase